MPCSGTSTWRPPHVMGTPVVRRAEGRTPPSLLPAPTSIRSRQLSLCRVSFLSLAAAAGVARQGRAVGMARVLPPWVASAVQRVASFAGSLIRARFGLAMLFSLAKSSWLSVIYAHTRAMRLGARSALVRLTLLALRITSTSLTHRRSLITFTWLSLRWSAQVICSSAWLQPGIAAISE